MANDRVKFLDTTLRDGEQSAGIGMTAEEKMEIAKQLEKLRVDIIEAGFPASSPGDFQAVSNIAREIRMPVICALARAHPNDVDQAWEAIKGAASPRIHVFLSSSDIHVMHQLRKNREEVMEMAVTMVERAKKHCDDVEFSPMDATRTNPEYLFQMMEAVIRAGATTINIADTVGYAIPSDFANLLRRLQEEVSGMDKVTLSVHCHNDLGLAVSNSLAAIEVGARQVEGCINGIGERAGNASLEEIIMGLDTRKDLFGVDIGIDTTQLYPASRLVSSSASGSIAAGTISPASARCSRQAVANMRCHIARCSSMRGIQPRSSSRGDCHHAACSSAMASTTASACSMLAPDTSSPCGSPARSSSSSTKASPSSSTAAK